MTYHIDVTKSDIADGCPAGSTNCAVALAVRRSTGCDEVTVDTCTIVARFGSSDLRSADTPPAAARFIVHFDKRHHVKPFSFDLEL